MSNESKLRIFESVLSQAYDHEKYVQFLGELLNNVKLLAPNRWLTPYNTFSAIIAGYSHIGYFEGRNGKRIALFSIQLKSQGNVENARSTQRSFIKNLLNDSGSSGALVAFYTPNSPEKWRLSLVRMEYEFAAGKISEKLTPAKRYSYLVGQGEPCHTAKDRLFPIFCNDEVDPSLDELEEAFSVEAVTKEFFEAYKEKYLQVKEYLESNPDFAEESSIRGFTSEQFTKKMMGQLVFLYFIQKKGWLGVNAIPTKMTEHEYKNAFYSGKKAREIVPKVYLQQADGNFHINVDALESLSGEDETYLAGIVRGQPWGTGPKNFMRLLFEGCKKKGGNYFDDYLEPMFYQGLNVNRGRNGFFPRFHRRIPFLNGGLFEQLDNYDWENNNFSIPNELFSNADVKGKDEADGILDIFDRYNFTMAEDEPMEREVAIDPEMLGKVFENLLDVKDRKSKGAFYTPREIVHYMCQESLINYLVNKTGIADEDIRKFILYGEYFRDADTQKTLYVKDETGKGHYELDKERDLEMPASIFSYKNGVNRLKEIDDLLTTVRVADPAVGSGAFPLGLLNEIVRARQTLTAYLAIEMNGFERKRFYSYGRKPYDLKVNTIKNCIYACDIEPSATDITKLRLWLSIVIDDQTTERDDIMFDEQAQPRQLPNLDCNIICGNSLVDEFEGIKLIKESDLLGNTSDNNQISIFQSGTDSLLQRLIDLQDKLYFMTDHEGKEDIKEQIQEIYDQIILEQLRVNPEAVEKYDELKSQASKAFVLWQLYFPKVFRENGGFDIIIGNPPYGADLTEYEKELYKKKFSDVHMRTPDTYNYFISFAFRILRENGTLSYIVPNTLLYQNEYEKARLVLYRDNTLKSVINIGEKVFEKAEVPTCVFVCIKKRSANYKIQYVDFRDIPNDKIIWGNYGDNITDEILNEIPGHVFGVSVAGSNVLKKIRDNSTTIDAIAAEVAAGISTGGNEVFCITKSFAEEHKFEAELLKPMLAGKNIDSYETVWKNEYMIYSHKHSNTPAYPNIYAYMLPYKDKLSKKRETRKGLIPWWSLHWPRVPELFMGNKIVMRQTSDRIRATYDSENFYALNSLLVLKLKDSSEDSYMFVLAVLNSKLCNYVYMNLTQEKGRTFAEVKPKNVRKLNIPLMDDAHKKSLAELTKKILSKEMRKEVAMNEIDRMLYDYYGLTNDEIATIENA